MQKKEMPSKTCLACGAVFTKRPRDTEEKWSRHKYCSHACEYTRRKGFKHSEEFGKKISATNKGRIMSKEARAKLSEACKGRRIPPAVRAKISQTLRGRPGQTGEKCSFYVDGRTPAASLIRCSYKYKEWRRQIFARDNYTCQLCGKRNSKETPIKIQADHFPKQFSRFLDLVAMDYGPENLYAGAMNCEPLWDISNGRTLCVECHNKNKQGRGVLSAVQRRHLNYVKYEAWSRIKSKYSAGQIQHGGNLWEKKGIIDMAIDEAVDMIVYLFTLKQQIEASGVELGTITEEK